MTSSVVFRPAEHTDVGVVHRLRREFYAEDDSPWSEDEALRALDGLVAHPELGRVWVAFEAGAAVGYAVLTFSYSLEFHGRDAFVDELYLCSTHRGRRLGAEALALLEDACRREGVHALHLEVADGNAQAQSLYRRQGFTAHGRRLMTKWLTVDASL